MLKKKNIEHKAGMHYHYDKLLITLTLNLFIFNIFYIIFTASSDSNFPNITSSTNLTSLDFMMKNKINWCESIGILLHFFLISSFFLMSAMSILRYYMLIQPFKNIRRFNFISISMSYVISGIIVIVTIFSSTGPIKYLSFNSKMYNFLLFC